MSEGCPVTAERLPPQHRKYVDFNGPAMGRMMAAKALVPLQPPDQAHVLFMLTFDPDEKVRAQAAATAVDDKTRKMLGLALREDDLDPRVLDWYAHTLAGKDDLLQLIALNNSAADETLAYLAGTVGGALAETISQNQLRLLRHTEILRQLCSNTNASKATVDLACDFAIRSGVVMDDVPQMKEARIRIHGPDVVNQPPENKVTADQLLAEMGEYITGDSPQPIEDGKRMTVFQKIQEMTIADKVKMATMGNKEFRTLFLRDSNKLVSMAAVRSPRITEGEILAIASSKTASDEVLRYIYSNREWTRLYPIKVALVKNSKVPPPIALKFLSTLRDSEVREIARDKNVSSVVQLQAKKTIDKKNAPVKVGKDD
jgi:hypothetical protein